MDFPGSEFMSYVALYRKWRPITFDQVVEQASVVTILKNTVISKRIAHAYLFCGTRGTGKTTMAKIFARAINCLSPQEGNPCNECEICKGILNQQILDVIEIDAASNNGVDNIRDIIDAVAYASAQAKYRVYIIDEVHMLSTGAFNALLKTLEEPPQDVVFILATTEPHRLPATILSRCQRYDFKRISRIGITERLEEICKNLNIEYEKAALNLLAQRADGALRDAISLLDQTIVSSNGTITAKTAREATGSIDRPFLENFAKAVLQSNGADILQYIDYIFIEGQDPSNFITELMTIFRDMMVILTVRQPEKMLLEDGEDLARLKEIAGMTNTQEVTLIIKELSKLDNNLKWAVQRKIIFEAGMLKLCDRNFSGDNEDIQVRLKLIENRIAELISNGVRIASKPDILISKANKDDVIKVNEVINQIEDKEPTTKTIARNSKIPIAELDWIDFINNVSSKNSIMTASFIKMNSKGFTVDGEELYLVFENKNIKDMVSKSDNMKIFEEAAENALGKNYHVQCIMKSDFDSLMTQNKAEKSSDKKKKIDDFEMAIEVLDKMSKDQGFKITEID